MYLINYLIIKIIYNNQYIIYIIFKNIFFKIFKKNTLYNK